MLHYAKIQREAHEVVRVTCNKCGQHYKVSEPHPNYTTIENMYGYGSQKDGEKYTSHICEPCMDEIYASFAIPPQVVSAIEWGIEPASPKVLESDESDKI